MSVDVKRAHTADTFAAVVVDRTTAARLSREMTRWGHHYNQAVHALNAIAYYLRANDMETKSVSLYAKCLVLLV